MKLIEKKGVKLGKRGNVTILKRMRWKNIKKRSKNI